MQKSRKSVRKERFTFLANEEEKRMIDSYLRKYKINNRSRWIRETLITFIIKKLDQDYPTLFNEHDMRR
ncbi:MAG: hypothetical protein J6T18_02680 [Bacteroidaceae bacterium]|nr:hypothetical protein [Bacteroidaceae bacterium]MBO7588313.1 hypothetical protein [Bacteroidaceae bacterium]MBP5646815.1 hypothetical protein [Bacteroidaceae bacterium]